MKQPLTFGFPRMREEANERRDYLPKFIGQLARYGAQIKLEYECGHGMGFVHEDYKTFAPSIEFVSHDEAYKSDFVFVLRCPSYEELQRLQAGSCLISMLHYPTRPERTRYIRSLGIEAISLDSLKDDSNRRLVENLRAVAWNGLEVTFQTLCSLYPPPGFYSQEREPIRVTLMGSGAVGVHAVQAAIRYGDLDLWKEMVKSGIPGVQVTVIDYDTTPIEKIMHQLLEETDILVDATQRPDHSKPIIPNHWIDYLPQHAILLDLSVDPYDCGDPPGSAKGIEGIPQGNLDQYVFAPDDSAYAYIPDCVAKEKRRFVISCYSWPGIHPKDCMRIYGRQLNPIFRTLIEKGGLTNINPRGNFFERAISRAMLSRLGEV